MTSTSRPWILLLFAAACSQAGGRNKSAAASPDSCEGCHAKIHPGLVADHDASPHRSVPVRCEDCHGTDHEKMFADDGAVPPTVCARCHEAAFEAFAKSRHGIRLREGKMDELLVSLPLPIGGCTATGGCHSIQQVYPDGSVGRCSSCHPTHAFANHEARNPRICIGCHEGSDHPQHRAWLRSAHALSSPSGRGHVADCVECHGTHDVSDAVVHGLPPVPDLRPARSVLAASTDEFHAARATMLERCARCHTRKVARAALEKADFWRHRGALLLDQAARIVEGLHRDGLLDPPPDLRPLNPITGHGLRLGGPQIFDQSTSLPERIYYELHFKHYPALWRALYHTDPERVVWELNDDMKSAIDRLAAIDREKRRAAREGAGE